MRYDDWDRAMFFVANYEALSWANRAVGAAKGIAAPIPERTMKDIHALVSNLRQCADELAAIAGENGSKADDITAMAAGE